MKLVTYNMFGGMKGNTIISNLKSHYYLYISKSIKEIRERSKDISDVIDLIKESCAKIICINEVIYEIQKEKIINSLKKMGYKSISIDRASNRNFSLDLCTILASKYKAKEIPIKITKGNSMISEASACSLYHPNKNLTIIGVHLSLLNKLRRLQLSQLSHFIKDQQNKNRGVIIMGDFNDPAHKLQKHSEFKKLNLISERTPTFPTFGFFNFIKRDYDHIFHSKSQKVINIETKGSKSDHYMLSYEIIQKKKQHL